MRQLIIDVWSLLSYKPVTADLRRPGGRAFPELARGWMLDHAMRCLAVHSGTREFTMRFSSTPCGARLARRLRPWLD